MYISYLEIYSLQLLEKWMHFMSIMPNHNSNIILNTSVIAYQTQTKLRNKYKHKDFLQSMSQM